MRALQHTYSFKKFILTVALPIIAFWTALFFFRYPLPEADDLFFIGAAINLAKGGEFTNPYLESWHSVFSSGKFYFQPPFHSYTLAGWLKIAGVSSASLRLFQYLCYNTFCLSFALILKKYGFPKITAIFTAILFAIWHCNPNPFFGTGLRQDALGMAYLGLGLWLLTKDNLWRYFIGFTFVVSAVLTSPITAAYAIGFGVSISILNLMHHHQLKKINKQYLLTRALTLLAATALVFFLFLLCINFQLQTFISEFFRHASLRRTPANIAFSYFIEIITRAYGPILIVPSYILFLALAIVVFLKRHFISLELKILFIALTVGIFLNILLYSSATDFTFFFCWLGTTAIIAKANWQKQKKLIISTLAVFIFLSSQSLNILSLLAREYAPEYQYEEIREFVRKNPDKKYAIDEVAARFVFDYKLPKNSVALTFITSPLLNALTSSKDKLPNVTWIAATFWVADNFPEMKVDAPKVKFLGRKFNSLPKKPFDVTMIK